MNFERTLFDLEQDSRSLINKINSMIEQCKLQNHYTCIFTIVLPISSYKAIRLFCPEYIIGDKLLGNSFYTLPNGTISDFLLQVDKKYDDV